MKQQSQTGFTIQKEQLIKIVRAAKTGQEAEVIEKLGGLQQLEVGLQTNFENGIHYSSLEERKLAFGGQDKEQSVGYLVFAIEAIKDTSYGGLMAIFLAAMIIKLIFNDPSWIQEAVILASLFIWAIFISITAYLQARQLNARRIQYSDVAKVWRGGTQQEIDTNQLMVGDIVQISTGMRIPADCLVLESQELVVDEAAIVNCQLQQVDSQQATPILFQGSFVYSGCGKVMILVVPVQINEPQEQYKQFNLQYQLLQVKNYCTTFGFISTLLIGVVLIIRFLISRVSESTFSTQHIIELFQIAEIIITILIIQVIPRGQLLMPVFTLANSAKHMLQDNNLVRQLRAIEQLASVDMLLTDKTGVLTENNLSVTAIWNDKLRQVDSKSWQHDISEHFNEELVQLFLRGTVVNRVKIDQNLTQTEQAVESFVKKCQIPYDLNNEWSKITTNIPFTSRRKMQSAIYENKLLVVKGASEKVVEYCSHYHSKEHGIIPINSQSINDTIDIMGQQSLRTLAVAYKVIDETTDITAQNQQSLYDIETSGLTLICLFGMRAPIKRDIPRAIHMCQTAGISVKMVTGDNKSTATQVAKDCGIINDDKPSLVMEGPEFINQCGGIICRRCQSSYCDCPNQMQNNHTIKNQSAFDQIYPTLNVLARSRPEDKYALVVGLQQQGHVVAMTGDGTNDAPALKQADVGFAMGIEGTEMAKNSAAIILLDDNFVSIVKAVLWGRNVYESIKKYLQFQLTMNLVAVCLTLIGAAILKQEILKPIQILWVNLIIDIFVALIMANEGPNQDVLSEKPQKRFDSLVTPRMWKHILGQSVYQLIILVILLFSADKFIPEYSGNEDGAYANHMNYKYSDSFYDSKGYTCPNPNYCNVLASGRQYNINGDEEYFTFYSQHYIPSRHFTLIFNQFVILQIFNLINSRTINNNQSLLTRIFQNKLLIRILIGIFIAQVLIVTFSGIVFNCYPFYGLQIYQWLICIALGSGSLLMNILLQQLPNRSMVLNQPVSRKQGLKQD